MTRSKQRRQRKTNIKDKIIQRTMMKENDDENEKDDEKKVMQKTRE